MPWNVSTAVYTNKSVYIGDKEVAPYSVTFSSDGTKMYIVGINSDRVWQYTLSTAWDVSTATYASKNKGISSQESAPRDIVFNSDGTIMYLVGDGYDKRVNQYTLSTAWDVSTATYANKSVSVQAQDSLPRGIVFNPTGTKMYMVGDNTDTVYQYTLSTAWDVSTATYASKSKSVSAQDTSPCDVDFSPTGTKMYIMGNANDTVYQYTLTTAWDVSTATYASKNSGNLSTQEGYPLGFAFSSDGTKMYIVGSDDDTVYQYTLVVSPTGIPTVTSTGPCTDRQSTTMTAVGNITNAGGAYTDRGFEYYEYGDNYDSEMYAVREKGDFTETGEFTMTINGLKPLTIYYIRAWAGNIYGIAYGEWYTCITTAVITGSYEIYEENNSEPDSDGTYAGGNTISFYVRKVGGKWSKKYGPYHSDQVDIAVADVMIEGTGKYQVKFESGVLTGISTQVMCKLDIKAR